MEEILQQLKRTCRGIKGSMLIRGDETVLAQDLPDLLGECDVQHIASQVCVMFELFDDALPKRAGCRTFHEITIKYGSIWCYCQRTPNELLIVMLDPGTDTVQVSGFTELALKRISRKTPSRGQA